MADLHSVKLQRFQICKDTLPPPFSGQPWGENGAGRDVSVNSGLVFQCKITLLGLSK